MRSSSLSLTLVTTAAIALAACGDNPAAPRAIGAGAVLSGAVHDQIEFDNYNNFDIALSCVNGLTHWEGWVHVVVNTVTTPKGLVGTRIHVQFAPDYFVEMPDGKRYYPVSFQVREHHTDGKISNIAGTAAGVFRSNDGDTIPLGFHLQVVVNPNGDAVVDWKFTGACP